MPLDKPSTWRPTWRIDGYLSVSLSPFDFSALIGGHRLGTAGAGSLIIEFGVLSRLTGDPRFEKAAYKAFFAIWNRKSDIGLVGNTINAWTGVGAQ